MKKRVGIIGPGGGGSGINPKKKEVLDHLEYDEKSEMIKSDSPISTTMNSFYLGDQHKISSGGENIFFTNITSDIDFQPCWTGLKDQKNTANRDETGILKPSGRVYSKDLLEIKPYGNHSTGILDYTNRTTLTVNTSLFGVHFVLGEDIKKDEKLHYTVRNHAGKLIYEQEYKIVSDYWANLGFSFWFDHPCEGFKDETVDVTMSYMDRPLKVRNSKDDPTKAYVMFYMRTFEDELLGFKKESVPVYLPNQLPSHPESDLAVTKPSEIDEVLNGDDSVSMVGLRRIKRITIKNLIPFSSNDATITQNIQGYYKDSSVYYEGGKWVIATKSERNFNFYAFSNVTNNSGAFSFVDNGNGTATLSCGGQSQTISTDTNGIWSTHYGSVTGAFKSFVGMYIEEYSTGATIYDGRVDSTAKPTLYFHDGDEWDKLSHDQDLDKTSNVRFNSLILGSGGKPEYVCREDYTKRTFQPNNEYSLYLGCDVSDVTRIDVWIMGRDYDYVGPQMQSFDLKFVTTTKYKPESCVMNSRPSGGDNPLRSGFRYYLSTTPQYFRIYDPFEIYNSHSNASCTIGGYRVWRR